MPDHKFSKHSLRAVQEIGMVQLMAPGRILLGIGSGHQPHEFRTYGIDLSARTQLLHEGWDILEQAIARPRLILKPVSRAEEGPEDSSRQRRLEPHRADFTRGTKHITRRQATARQ